MNGLKLAGLLDYLSFSWTVSLSVFEFAAVAFVVHRTVPRAGYQRVIIDARAIGEGANVVPFEDVGVSELEYTQGWRRLDRYFYPDRERQQDTALASETFDDYLCCAERIPVVVDKQTVVRGIPASERGQRDDQIEYLKTVVTDRSKITTDDAKVLLDAPLTVPLRSPRLIRSSYFRSIMTTDAYCHRVVEKQRHGELSEPLMDMTQYYPLELRGTSRVLKAHPVPGVSSHLAGSTIAICSQGKPLFFQQRADQFIGAGKIVPSGSGSMDWSDIANARDRTDLLSIVRQNIARELVEETRLWRHHPKLRKSEVINIAASKVVVTGLFRSVRRAGKPDFVSAIRLEQSYNEILPDEKEVTDAGMRHVFGGNALITVSRLKDFADVLDALLNYEPPTDNKRLAVSESCIMCLHRLVTIAGYRDSTDATKRKVYTKVARGLEIA